MKNIIGLFVLALSSCTFAWDSPSDAVHAYLKFEMDGGRVFIEKRSELLNKYSSHPIEPASGKPYPIFSLSGFTGINVVESFSLGNVKCNDDDTCTVKVVIKPPLNAAVQKEDVRASKLGSQYFEENPNFVHFPSMMPDRNERDDDLEVEVEAYRENGNWRAFGASELYISLATFSEMINRAASK